MKKYSFTIAISAVLFLSAQIAFSQIWDASDYSEYKTAGQYLDAYPDQQSYANYPEFSWDKVTRWTILRSGEPFDTVDIKGIAEDFQVIVMEKANSQGLSYVEDGTIRAGERLKAVNPKLKTFFYWNTVVNYWAYEANIEFEPNAWDWCQMTPGADGQDTFKLIRESLRMFDSNVPELREWWVRTAKNVVADPAIDGVFIDKVNSYEGGAFFDENGDPATNYIRMLDSLDKSLPDSSLYIGNTIRNERWNGNREQMRYQDGSYLERQEFIYRGSGQTEVEARVVNLQLMREMATKGKMVFWRLGPQYSHLEVPTVQTEENMIQYYKNAVEFPLAMHLISAEKYTYFGYLGTVDATQDKYMYLTDYIPELNRPLGEPLGPPTKEGYIFTRSFEYVDVWLNMETEECMLTWRDPIPDPSLALTDFSTYPNSITVKTKGSGQIGASFSPLEAGNTSVIWISSDTTIAKVDSSGVLTGLKEGSVTVTGTSEDGGFSDFTWVKVVKDLVGVVPSGVNIAPTGTASQSSTDYSGEASRAIDDNINGAYTQSSVSHTASESFPWWQVDLGDEYSIGFIKLYGRTDDCCKERLSDYTVYVLNANGDTTFSQSFASYPDPYEIIEVGDVRGKTVIVQLNKTGALSLAEVQVYINPVNVTGLEIKESNLTIQLEDSYQLNAIISPSNATFQELSWSSNKKSVATVDSTGRVTGTSIGLATISATTLMGDFSASCRINVTGIWVTSLSVSPESAQLYPGDTVQLIGTITPENAGDTIVRWESDDIIVASVDTEGKVIALAEGSATVTASSKYGEFTDECIITVNSPVGLDRLRYEDSAFNWEGATLEIYNTMGMLILKQEAISSAYLFELNNLPRGIYIVIGKNQGSVITKMIHTDQISKQ